MITFKKEMLNQKHDLEFEQMRAASLPPLRAAPPAPRCRADVRRVDDLGGETVPAMAGSVAPASVPAAPAAPAPRT